MQKPNWEGATTTLRAPQSSWTNHNMPRPSQNPQAHLLKEASSSNKSMIQLGSAQFVILIYHIFYASNLFCGNYSCKL